MVPLTKKNIRAAKSKDGWVAVNRLRHSDYLRLFREAGFTILEESSVLGEVPSGLTVARQFRHYAAADLYAIKGRILAA